MKKQFVVITISSHMFVTKMHVTVTLHVTYHEYRVVWG